MSSFVHYAVLSKNTNVVYYICIPEKALSYGEVQVFATGENGKSVPIRISSIVKGTNHAAVKDGKIVLHGINPQERSL